MCFMCRRTVSTPDSALITNLSGANTQSQGQYYYCGARTLHQIVERGEHFLPFLRLLLFLFPALVCILKIVGRAAWLIVKIKTHRWRLPQSNCGQLQASES